MPVVLLPMVSLLAVMLPISVDVRPRLAELSAPPRFTSAPSVCIRTFPAVVALTVPNRSMLFAVSVIRPAAVEILLVTTRLLPVRLIPPVPFVESGNPTVILLAVLLVISDRLPLAGRLMADVTAILPVLLPMVSRLAVMLPISTDVRPKLPLDFVPRSTAVPEVGINSTEPEVVALTVLVMVTFWAVI